MTDEQVKKIVRAIDTVASKLWWVCWWLALITLNTCGIHK
jgi:hypothetical protein